jgi:acetyl-CoA acetyltransferase
MDIRNKVAISGIGATDFTRASGRTTEQLAVDACKKAAADAGMPLSEVDGVVTFFLGDSATSAVVATSLGLPQLNHYADLSTGGSAACGVVLQAAMAIATGQARNVLVYRSMNGSSGTRYGGADFSRALAVTGCHSDAEEQFLDTAGITNPVQHFALLCRRHMSLYGTNEDDLGAVARTFRAHAERNPQAMKRKPLSEADYYASPMIASPLRAADCCLQTDGAVALLLTSAERARDLATRPVYVTAGVFGGGPRARGGMWGNFIPEHAECYAKYVSDNLFRMAGVARDELDFLQLYDCFTYSVLVQFEDFGFCRKGEAGGFFREGHAMPGGKLPVNTGGGLLSEAYIHGLNLVNEAVAQLRGGLGERQVEGARTCLVSAGGAATTGSALILSGAV